jgi:hypothetical protein
MDRAISSGGKRIRKVFVLALCLGLIIFSIAKAQPGVASSSSAPQVIKLWDEASRGPQVKLKVLPVAFVLLVFLSFSSFLALPSQSRYVRLARSEKRSAPNRVSESHHWFRPPPLS